MRSLVEENKAQQFGITSPSESAVTVLVQELIYNLTLDFFKEMVSTVLDQRKVTYSVLHINC